MSSQQEYGGLDRFRMVAAFLVVAIHTGPLLSLNETLDAALTHVLARVAVPFFFMATGFFLLPRYVVQHSRDWHPLRRFLGKTGLIYLSSILIYLPVNMYAGHFADSGGIGRFLRGLLFDGTFYHLWYLPASMLGALLLVLLSRKLSVKPLLAVAGVLYLIGLFGDSYYGVTEFSTVATGVYERIFTVSAYTRNGLFFAPAFLLLGAVMPLLRGRMRTRTLAVSLGISFALMMAEGMLLHTLLPGRHNSMYVCLLPVMGFLFLLLMEAGGSSSARLRRWSLLIYLLHPMCIVGVRGMAKALGLTWLLVDQSLVFYVSVSVASFLIAILLERAAALLPQRRDPAARAWVEVNLENLRHNIRRVQEAMPESCTLMAVLKADAYGHGAVRVAKETAKLGVTAFCVATVPEGIALRKKGVRGEILVLGYTHDSHISHLVRYRLMQTVVDAADAKRLNAYGKKIVVHLKIDTGMHRLGERYDRWDSIEEMLRLPNLEVRGMFTHLCVSDSREEDGIRYTKDQIRHFQDCIAHLKAGDIPIPKVHIQSSYGLINYSGIGCDYARIGIALYGMFSQEEDYCPELLPVLSVKARVECVHDLRLSEPVGYGLDFSAPGDMRVASVAIGYADGIPRALSAKGEVLIHGRRARILGKICMDRLLADVTGIPEVQPGDLVTVIGREGDESISACRVAEQCGTISNEILSRLGGRLPRVYHNAG